MYQAVVYDFEATPGPRENESRIHTISLVPVTIGTTVTRQKGVLICIKDVIKREEVNLKSDVKTKIARAVIDVANYDMNIKYMNFYDAVKYMNTFIVNHGSILIGHNLIGDLGFLASTQTFVGGKRIIKNKIKEYPDTGMYDPNWSKINRVCSMSLLANRCNTMNQAFRKFVVENNLPLTAGGYIPLRLNTYTQFANNDPEYRQSHSAVQDTMDLIDVLKCAVKHEKRGILDGHDYMTKPEWVRAA